MAGRKQHYIPQSVLRAFEASRPGAKSQVLVFRKHKEPYVTSTEGTAAERDFYSNPLVDGKGALDDKITNFESEHLTAMLRELRCTRRGPVDSELAAITVAHLAFRTAHVRGSIQTIADDAVGQMKAIIEDPEAIRHFAGVDAATTDPRLAEMVGEELTRLGLDALPQKDRKAIERMVVFRVRERFDDLFLQSKNFVGAAIESFGMNAAGFITKGHARVLSESLVPQERVRALRALAWEVVPDDEAQRHFILPDCVVIASDGTTAYQPLPMLSVGEAMTVVMPLSPKQLLVGSACPVRIDSASLNVSLATCSLDFFIGSRRDDGTAALAALIGSCAAELKIDLLEADYTAPPPAIHTEFSKAKVAIRTPIGKVGEAMKSILSRLADETIEPTTANRLESITVATNMSRALEAVWKRTPTAVEVEAAVLGTVEPMKSGTAWKCRVILPRNLTQALLQSANATHQLAATRVVKLHLGRVLYFDCWARQCPEMVGSRPGLAFWDQLASTVAFRIGSHYFGGLTSARHGSEPFPGGERLEELAASFRSCFAALCRARQQFFVHRSVDQILVDSVGSIETLLIAVATVFGYLEAKDLALPRDSDAGDVLSEAGLWEWSLLFANDLRRHSANRERWSSSTDLDPLICHIERLLWTVGVVVSKMDFGHWIDVVEEARMPVLQNILRA